MTRSAGRVRVLVSVPRSCHTTTVEARISISESIPNPPAPPNRRRSQSPRARRTQRHSSPAWRTPAAARVSAAAGENRVRLVLPVALPSEFSVTHTLIVASARHEQPQSGSSTGQRRTLRASRRVGRSAGTLRSRPRGGAATADLSSRVVATESPPQPLPLVQVAGPRVTRPGCGGHVRPNGWPGRAWGGCASRAALASRRASSPGRSLWSALGWTARSRGWRASS